jgi:molecular chaperone DnaK
MIYTAEKTLKDAGDKAGEDDKKALEDEIAAAKTKLESTDKDELEKAASALSEKMQKVGAAMYQNASTAPGGDAAPEEVEATEADGQTGSAKADDGPVEGEVVDEGGKK